MRQEFTILSLQCSHFALTLELLYVRLESRELASLAGELSFILLHAEGEMLYNGRGVGYLSKLVIGADSKQQPYLREWMVDGQNVTFRGLGGK